MKKEQETKCDCCLKQHFSISIEDRWFRDTTYNVYEESMYSGYPLYKGTFGLFQDANLFIDKVLIPKRKQALEEKKKSGKKKSNMYYSY